MISVYSINYPALAAIAILCLVGFYHWWTSRRQEFNTLTFPSTVMLVAGENGVCLEHHGDITINGVISFDRLVCKNLYLGPLASLEGKTIEAQHIEVRGEIKHVDQLTAYHSLTNLNYVDAYRADTPKMLLGKKSISIIQIVERATEITRKRGAQTRGFFASADEMTGKKVVRPQSARERLATVRLIRKS
jgi:hypothetical protein